MTQVVAQVSASLGRKPLRHSRGRRPGREWSTARRRRAARSSRPCRTSATSCRVRATSVDTGSRDRQLLQQDGRRNQRLELTNAEVVGPVEHQATYGTALPGKSGNSPTLASVYLRTRRWVEPTAAEGFSAAAGRWPAGRPGTIPPTALCPLRPPPWRRRMSACPDTAGSRAPRAFQDRSSQQQTRRASPLVRRREGIHRAPNGRCRRGTRAARRGVPAWPVRARHGRRTARPTRRRRACPIL